MATETKAIRRRKAWPLHVGTVTNVAVNNVTGHAVRAVITHSGGSENLDLAAGVDDNADISGTGVVVDLQNADHGYTPLYNPALDVTVTF